MFGRQAAPTRVYAYGAKRPHEGLDAFRSEERAMHRLRNSLVEIELDRRKAARDAVLARFPEIAEAEERIAAIDAEIESLRAEIRRRNSAERRRRPADDPATPRIAELRAERGAIVGKHDPEADPCPCLRCRRRAAYADPALAAALAAVEDEARSRQKALYAARETSWANFNAVAQSMSRIRSGPPPRFVPWTGLRGRAVVQIQGGATWDELLSGVRQVQVAHVDVDTPAFRATRRGGVVMVRPPAAQPGGRRSKRPWYTVRLRIGRDARGDDQSRWVAVRFALHRPIPADARIQQVWIVRRRAGVTDDWSVQFVVARSAGWARPDTAEASGACGVDLRWRELEDGSLLVAYVEGQDGHREELVIPRSRLDQLRYTEHLRSIRDREFDRAKAALIQWLSTAENTPDWLREATASLDRWRSAPRLAGLVLRWRENRFDGDSEIVERMEAWRAQDRHLADWAAAQRRKFERWRLDAYRRFAARLRWRYETAILEDTDWRELLSRPPAEREDEPEVMNRRWSARAASPGLIRQVVQQSIEDTRLVDPADTSRRCSICGAGPARDWEPEHERTYRCEAGHHMPVWRNAALNLLAAASGAVVSE